MRSAYEMIQQVRGFLTFFAYSLLSFCFQHHHGSFQRPSIVPKSATTLLNSPNCLLEWVGGRYHFEIHCPSESKFTIQVYGYVPKFYLNFFSLQTELNLGGGTPDHKPCVTGFRDELKLWKSNLQENNVVHFECSRKFDEEIISITLVIFLNHIFRFLSHIQRFKFLRVHWIFYSIFFCYCMGNRFEENGFEIRNKVTELRLKIELFSPSLNSLN